MIELHRFNMANFRVINSVVRRLNTVPVYTSVANGIMLIQPSESAQSTVHQNQGAKTT